MTVTIRELVDVSSVMESRCNTLFETLGAWVATTAEPAIQQRFARAAHRHAWHAQLWAERRPTVPIDANVSESSAEATALDDDARLDWYLDQVSLLRTDLTSLVAGIDERLDPSTHRVVELILADLADELD